MMMDPKKVAEEIVGKGGDEPEPEPGSDLQALAQELIDAVQAGDAAGVAEAFRACFLACESEPHSEAGEPQ